jgi:hypothetical protein
MENPFDYYTKGLEETTAKLNAMIILARDTDLNEIQQEELAYLRALKKYLVKKIEEPKDYSNTDFADLTI